jgi:hypothetical protein
MRILKRDQFKDLLEKNPGQKFAFYEWYQGNFVNGIHVTRGDSDNPTFGAWSPVPDDFEYVYDWNIDEYDANTYFAVLEEDDLNNFMAWLGEINDSKS